MNTEFFTKKLPPYWKLATIRCSIYALTVGWAAFLVGIDGYDSLSQMTSLQLTKLFGGVIAAMLAVWLAFLDQSLTKFSNNSTASQQNQNKTQ